MPWQLSYNGKLVSVITENIFASLGVMQSETFCKPIIYRY